MPPKFKYTALALLGAVILGGGIFIGSKLSSSQNATSQGRSIATQEEIDKILSIPKPKAPVSLAPPKGSETTSDEINALAQLNLEQSDARTDIRIIEHLLDQVHSVFHELPTGDHDQVVAFLRGDNPLDIVYIPEDDPNLNADGEIIDRWGTPYFFHTLSRNRIEVRSAGPDKLHWSEDDVISESQTGGQRSVVAATP